LSRPATIPDALFATAERGAGQYVFHLADGIVRLSCEELAERAFRQARRLMARGVEPGDAVGVLGPNRPEWVVSAFATWIAGAVLVPVQIPLRIRDPDAFRERLRSLVVAGGCRLVFTDPALAELLPEGAGVTWEEKGEESAGNPPGAAPDSPAVIQFTSGSTSAPKGALIPHAAVMAQTNVLERGFHRDGVPRTTLSWTPYFHDLGLIANVLLAAVWGSTSNHLPTERFARDPAEWLRLVQATRAELTVAPSTAFGTAVKAAMRSGERIDLSSLEVAFFAAEGVDPEVAGKTMAMAEERFGFPGGALGSSYGLAEAVMAASYSIVGSGVHVDRISLDELAASGAAVPAEGERTKLMVSAGPPVPPMGVRIVADSGERLPERHVGEVQLRGPSLMSGYVGADAPDPFIDGWLRTGDLGYMADGELYISGRAKGMVISMGHNYYPEDFEWAAARADGVRPGRTVAFSLPDSERIVVLVEVVDGRSPNGLRLDVKRAVTDAVGVSPDEVLVLPSGAVEKTTSGKLRRGAMRDAYLDGTLAGIGPN
jgi:fatty-acyl-CoA synthase